MAERKNQPGGTIFNLDEMGFQGKIVPTRQPGHDDLAEVTKTLTDLHNKFYEYLKPPSDELREANWTLNGDVNYRRGALEAGDLTGHELMMLSPQAQQAYLILREDSLMRDVASKFNEKQKKAGSEKFKSELKKKQLSQNAYIK